jgi:hypothetical protein
VKLYCYTIEEIEDNKWGNNNLYIEEQTTQWQYKRTNNNLQNMHIKLKIEYHEPH